MLLEFIFEVVVRPEEESPAVDDTRWLCEAAAATGTENNDRKRGDAFLKAEANTLAASADSRANSVVCCAGMGNGGWDVCRIYTRRAGAPRQEISTDPDDAQSIRSCGRDDWLGVLRVFLGGGGLKSVFKICSD
jgi:hypothetical protein